jgi:hypothetical protein
MICTTLGAAIGSLRNCETCPEVKVRDPKPDLWRVGALAAGLGLQEHLNLIYDTQQQFAAALPCLRAGFERRERCLDIADENKRAAVPDSVRKTGIGVDRHLWSGAPIPTDKQETYLKPGRFDPDSHQGGEST